MKIIEPKAELLQQNDNVAHVAHCARVCYKREKGNDKILYDNLIKNGHWSMFRHETQYYIIPGNVETPSFIFLLSNVINKLRMPSIGIDIKESIDRDIYYVVVNGNWILSNPKYSSVICKYQVNKDLFINYNEADKDICREMVRYTFKVTTQISTSRELNRVSPNNISEQSTRYVYEDGTICRPHWLEGYKISQGLKGGLYVYKDENTEIEMNNKVRLYIESCERSFNIYKELIDYGLSRQDARGVLPLDTATVCAYTYSINEWRHIIGLRADKRAHPNAQIIANMIKKELNKLSYNV